MRHPTQPQPPSNILHLADYRVPSLRRPRPATARAPDGGWARMARERARASADAGARLVRVTHFPPAANASGAGAHLRISGRLADVCAELDRLADAEAGAPAAPQRRA